ncbi:50S ribosomal protein L35 [Rhodohalobacter barkolensis]|jgi:large subunit ribosomal protein L35|uniref:Large ribosomal subunit protein bL35 n=1 Tax=Rhodohalobacter barkolensis TaxID=2053187 RepID=A0A2N0VK45_9BACT|nr:50S ribosomal protein L35 [Rhodohalobacter barkolensis]PKD44562.1 50S ribosomal protein L35 [Rhodohalobacter barkolensis]
MPKMKSNSGAKKRFKVTGSGKIKRKKAYKRHILTKKSPKRKNNLGKDALVHKADESSVKDLLPYGGK